MLVVPAFLTQLLLLVYKARKRITFEKKKNAKKDEKSGFLVEMPVFLNNTIS